jgi:hypothetical protein
MFILLLCMFLNSLMSNMFKLFLKTYNNYSWHFLKSIGSKTTLALFFNIKFSKWPLLVIKSLHKISFTNWAPILLQKIYINLILFLMFSNEIKNKNFNLKIYTKQTKMYQIKKISMIVFEFWSTVWSPNVNKFLYSHKGYFTFEFFSNRFLKQQ